MNRRTKVIIFSILGGVLVVLLCLYIWYYNLENKRTINNNGTFVVIEKNSSLDKVIDLLAKKKVLGSVRSFKGYSKIKGFGEPVPGGHYIFKPGTTYKALLEKLKHEGSDFAIITIPEGFSIYQIADRMEKNNIATKKDFLEAKLQEVNTGGLLNPPNQGVVYEMEGYLFPDTYYIPTGTSPADVKKLMYNNFEKIFNEKYRARAKELGLSVNDIISIASLIEREAANDSERSKIAGVIYNRMKKDMLLQIDAAVVYAKTEGEKSVGKLTKSDLKILSKYNTYIYKGLPPGPIACPGKPSIEAALYPETHDYYYYVLGDNGHVFSKTYEEHVNNVKKYIK